MTNQEAKPALPLWRRLLRLTIAVLALALLAAWGLRRAASHELPVLARTPAFTLTDESGVEFSSTGLSGNPWIAAFIFTRCSSTCPRMSARMAELQKNLPAEVRLVAVSVDPEWDKPEVLAAYARRWGAEKGRWVFLTGERESIYALARAGFFLPASEAEKNAPPEAPPTEAFIHSDRLVLVDGEGAIRGYYDSGDEATMRSLESVARGLARRRPAWTDWLPGLNASLNSASACFLAAGFAAIRRKKVELHRLCMLSALVVSALFLVSYLVYHFHAGATRFPGEGALRALYFTILISHTTLAAALPFLVGVTLWRALKGNFEQHRRIARWTLPLWFYVSVTGVLIYAMLYFLPLRG